MYDLSHEQRGTLNLSESIVDAIQMNDDTFVHELLMNFLEIETSLHARTKKKTLNQKQPFTNKIKDYTKWISFHIALCNSDGALF